MRNLICKKGDISKMLIAFDPYAGTLGRYKREEIVKFVKEAGCEGLNVPLRAEFINAEDTKDLQGLP